MMKQFLQTIAIAGLLTIYSYFANSQPPLDISDPNVYILDTTPINITMRIEVGINNLQNAKAVNFSIGSEKDKDDIKKINVPVFFDRGSYFLKYENENQPLSGNRASVKVTLTSNQYKKLKFISIHAEDKSGKATAKKYIQLK